jgi:hypothetical protein
MKKFFTNILLTLERYYSNYVKKRERKKELIKLIKNFEKDYNVSVEEINQIIKHPSVYCEIGSKKQLYNDKLKEAREHILKIDKYVKKTPFIYEPEIVDIHNEHRHSNKFTLNELVLKDEKDSHNYLKKQEAKK